MAPPATGTALIVLVAFVLPGFITVLFQERTFKQADDPTPLDRLLRAIYYSIWCYLLLAAVALVLDIDRAYVERLYERHASAPAELVWRAALAVFLPATAVWCATLVFRETGASEMIAERMRLNARHQQPTSWDFWFRKGVKSHVRIVFADGRSVWGFYGERSFASYAKDGRDLFLEHIYRERVVPDEADSDIAPGPWFGTPHPSNRGGWVALDDAVCVEIYDFPDDEDAEDAASGAKDPRSPSASGTAGPD
jgi:Family of unknown function (DUF6338)